MIQLIKRYDIFMEAAMRKSTEEMQNDISKMKTIEELEAYIEREGIGSLNFGERLLELCSIYRVKPGDLQKNVAISKALFYAIISGERNPGKATVIKIALALGITLDETNELLKLSRHKELYPKIKEDAILIFGINNRKDLYEIDGMLKKIGSSISLGEKG